MDRMTISGSRNWTRPAIWRELMIRAERNGLTWADME
jgi:hypothetical protein